MPILQKTLEEPLLTRQQSAVVREIARASQLVEAYKILDSMANLITMNNGLDATSAESINQTKRYLQAESTRVLTQIKTPVRPDQVSNVPVNVPK